MESWEGTAIGYGAEGEQAVRGKGGGAGWGALVQVRVEGTIVIEGGA